MAADIGARIGIDGEKAFRDSLGAINSQMKNLSSEMKAIVSAFAGMEDSEEALTAKNDVLQRSIKTSADKIELLQGQSQRAKKKLDDLAEELSRTTAEFGANSAEALKAQNAYNRQVTVINKLETQINQTTAEMSKMEREMKTAGKAADDLGDDLKKMGQNAEDAKDEFLGSLGGNILSGAIQSLASGILNLVDASTEYRKIMGTLETSSEKAGYTAEQTAETYNQLYGVIGDNQAAVTAAANLQALGLEQEQLKQLTDGAIGAWAKYGDSIPIDSLAEAINETAQAGKVTGTFADVLNWAGTNEDAFNAKLEAAGSQAERVNIILEELTNQGLMDTAEAWRQNNAEIVAANEATANLEATTGRLGTMLSPIVTTLKEGLNTILSTLLDMVEQGNPLLALAAGLTTAIAGMGLAMFITQGTASVEMLTKMKTAFTALTAAMKANPILLVVSLLAGLVAALVTAYQTNEEFRNKVNAAWEALKGSVGAAVGKVKGFVEDLRLKFQNFVNWMKNLPNELKNIGKNVITGLWNGINEKLSWIKTKARNAVDSIKNLFSGVTGFDVHSPSRWSKDLTNMVMQGMGNEFKSNTFAANAAGVAIDRIKDRMNRSLQSINDSMASVATPRFAMAGAAGTTNNYTHGGINVYVNTVNNGNGRDTETMARELDFLTRQTAWGRGDSR